MKPDLVTRDGVCAMQGWNDNTKYSLLKVQLTNLANHFTVLYVRFISNWNMYDTLSEGKVKNNWCLVPGRSHGTLPSTSAYLIV